MAEQYGFSKPPKQYIGILIQQIPGSSYSILQYTANPVPVSNHRPMVRSTAPCVPGTWYQSCAVTKILAIFIKYLFKPNDRTLHVPWHLVPGTSPLLVMIPIGSCL